ncbi:MAG: hypothetical protein KIH08_10890 [Candidatus Freyarchaeota archaeon]|nr:hypothetical protein [Candidatus Jordarchaeia archaeon]MBS7268728.1 hypothetical protein [Candidatus Jordarchaeia archaeon]MBS7279393.1 hypothetical protein [Candidatus Jordarchaeia archaeon]
MLIYKNDKLLNVGRVLIRVLFVGKLVKYNCNPRRLITLEGEFYILERVLRCSNPGR